MNLVAKLGCKLSEILNTLRSQAAELAREKVGGVNLTATAEAHPPPHIHPTYGGTEMEPPPTKARARARAAYISNEKRKDTDLQIARITLEGGTQTIFSKGRFRMCAESCI